MYVHDPDKGVLTLAGTTHTRPIDLAVRVRDDTSHLMVAVARTSRHLVTRNALREYESRGLRRPADGRRYTDGACLVAPLVSGGRLWGILNFSCRRERAATGGANPPLAALFAFLGRALRFARAYRRARTQARVDPLTGLYNQRWMFETLTKEVRRTQRFGTPLAAVMADLDGLKAVNDRSGHPAGDCLLRHVAGRITSVLREFDSAARVGGDEFVVLLPGTDLQGAHAVARRVLEAIRSDAAMFRGVPLPIRASLGVAQWRPGWDAARLLEAADRAMYDAKQQGRGQVVCHPHDPLATVRLTSDPQRWAWPAGGTSARPTGETSARPTGETSARTTGETSARTTAETSAPTSTRTTAETALRRGAQGQPSPAAPPAAQNSWPPPPAQIDSER
jgi:diguanylate cyclase (GGDEF)-like protein